MDTLLSQDDPPYEILAIRPNARCPACAIDMIIAGRYDRDGKNVEGKASIRLQCHGCGKLITPVSIQS
jgi:hypothetical protein